MNTYVITYTHPVAGAEPFYCVEVVESEDKIDAFARRLTREGIQVHPGNRQPVWVMPAAILEIRQSVRERGVA